MPAVKTNCMYIGRQCIIRNPRCCRAVQAESQVTTTVAAHSFMNSPHASAAVHICLKSPAADNLIYYACCVGWYVAAVVTGAYNLPSKQKQTVSRAVTTAARAWLLATPVSVPSLCGH